MKKILLIIFICSLTLSGILGCGYTTRSMLSDEYRTIYITPFTNSMDITKDTDTGNRYKITRPFLETDVTRAVSNKYLFDGNLKPVKSENADLILKGELVDFRKDPLRYDDNNNVSEYRINVLVNLSLWDKKNAKLLWQETNFTGYNDYFVSGSQAKSESQAINDAMTDLARRVVERTVEQW